MRVIERIEDLDDQKFAEAVDRGFASKFITGEGWIPVAARKVISHLIVSKKPANLFRILDEIDVNGLQTWLSALGLQPALLNDIIANNSAAEIHHAILKGLVNQSQYADVEIMVGAMVPGHPENFQFVFIRGIQKSGAGEVLFAARLDLLARTLEVVDYVEPAR